MKRKNSKTEVITTQSVRKRQKFDAASMFAALELRVSALEKEIHRAQIENLEAQKQQSQATSGKVKRGPKCKLRSADFVLFRDNIVDMLESYWPELEPLCRPKVNAQDLWNFIECNCTKGQFPAPTMRDTTAQFRDPAILPRHQSIQG